MAISVTGRGRTWSPIWYVVPGIVVGIALDRLFGSPGGLSAGILLVGSATAVVTLLGPILSERSRQRFDADIERSRRIEEHAVELAEDPLSYLHTARSTFRELESKDDVDALDDVAITFGDSHTEGPIEGARFWGQAVAHIQADTAAGPAWIELHRLARLRATRRHELDELTKLKVKQMLQGAFGGEFEVRRTSAGPGPPKWVDIGRATELVRQDWARPQVTKFATTFVSSTAHEPDLPRTEFRVDGLAVGAVETDISDAQLETFRIGLMTLAGDSELRDGLADVRKLDESVRKQLLTFRQSAWEFYQHVRLSRTLPGRCEECNAWVA